MYPYVHWIIGLGNSGQRVIEEISSQEANRAMNLVVIKVGDRYQALPKGNRVDYDNFIVLPYHSEHRSHARDALLRDIRDRRPLSATRFREMLKSGRRNIIWLVGSIFESQVTGMVFDLAHILRRIGQSLIARGSRYAAVLQALLVLAWEAAIDASAVPRATDRAENLDADWFEKPAFAGEALPSSMGAGRPPQGKVPSPR